MTDMETRARDLLSQIADEMPTAPLLARLERRVPALRWRRRLVAAGRWQWPPRRRWAPSW